MLRAIFRRRMRDAVSGCEVTNQLFSFRVDVPSIENELRKGGFGEAGYEVVELIGMEIEKPDADPQLADPDNKVVREAVACLDFGNYREARLLLANLIQKREGTGFS